MRVCVRERASVCVCVVHNGRVYVEPYTRLLRPLARVSFAGFAEEEVQVEVQGAWLLLTPDPGWRCSGGYRGHRR